MSKKDPHDMGGRAEGKGIPLGYPDPEDDFSLFHWSPTDRREAINREGLRINRHSTDLVWRPPYIAFSDAPNLAWALSAARTDYANSYEQWDLWMTTTKLVEHFEMLPFDDGVPKEYRVYQNLKKSRIWFVGTRMANGKGY